MEPYAANAAMFTANVGGRRKRNSSKQPWAHCWPVFSQDAARSRLPDCPTLTAISATFTRNPRIPEGDAAGDYRPSREQGASDLLHLELQSRGFGSKAWPPDHLQDPQERVCVVEIRAGLGERPREPRGCEVPCPSTEYRMTIGKGL